MGIANFYSWIKEQYPMAFKKTTGIYDNVYIDLNYLLHMCSYNCRSKDEIISRLKSIIETIIKFSIPVKTLNLFTDGASSLAKLLLQRKRRLNISRSDKDLEISSLNFTPGTKFMIDLENNLKDLKKKIETIYNIKVNIFANSNDEAELKIKNSLMKNSRLSKNDTHIVVTNDADVVVMMLTNCNYEKICILFKDDNYCTLSLGELIKEHCKLYGTSKAPNLDFSFLSLFLGNDYIPKVNFATPDKLWKIYRYVLFDYPNGIIKINNISNTDDKKDKYEFIINSKFLVSLLSGLFGSVPIRQSKKINYRDSRSKLYENYYDGLTWCFDMYLNADCVRYNYMYEYPNSPHPLGLILSLHMNPEYIVLKECKYDCIDQDLYAILLLPRSAKSLISKKYYEFMDSVSNLYEQEDCKKCGDFHKELKMINSKIVGIKDSNDDNDKKELKKYKALSSATSKKLVTHKKNHSTLCLLDINDVVHKYNRYKNKYITKINS